MRCCGVGVRGAEWDAARYSAWQALHLSLTFSRLSVLKDRKAFISNSTEYLKYHLWEIERF